MGKIVKPKVDLNAREYAYLKREGIGPREIQAGHNTIAERIAEEMAAQDPVRQHAARIRARFEAGLSTAPELPELPQSPVSQKKPHLDLRGVELEAQRQREVEARRRRPREIAERFRKTLQRGDEDRGEPGD